VTDSPKLGVMARELILAPENSIYVSAVTLWEIAIKCALMGGGVGNRAGHTDMPVSAARTACASRVRAADDEVACRSVRPDARYLGAL